MSDVFKGGLRLSRSGLTSIEKHFPKRVIERLRAPIKHFVRHLSSSPKRPWGFIKHKMNIKGKFILKQNQGERGDNSIVSRRAGLHSLTQAGKRFKMKFVLYAKLFLLEGQTRQAKSSSRPVNLHGARPRLMKQLPVYQDLCPAIFWMEARC